MKLANDQITKKGLEINKFRETHNLKIRGQETVIDKSDATAPSSGTGAQTQEKSNVLVADYWKKKKLKILNLKLTQYLYVCLQTDSN